MTTIKANDVKIEVLDPKTFGFEDVKAIVDGWDNMTSFVEVGNVTMHGEFILDSVATDKWHEWRSSSHRLDLMRLDYLEGLAFLWTRVSFRALVVGSVLFAGDEWEPINENGELPYVSYWVANELAMYHKNDARIYAKIMLASEYGDMGKPGWWWQHYGSIYYTENGMHEFKTIGRGRRS